MKSVLSFAAMISLLAACTPKSGGETVTASGDELVSRGKAIYIGNCISCHNMDPKKDGAVGPSLFGSSLELVQQRVLKAQYPPGYNPKRETAQMVALPHLEKEIPALHAYLNAN